MHRNAVPPGAAAGGRNWCRVPLPLASRRRPINLVVPCMSFARGNCRIERVRSACCGASWAGFCDDKFSDAALFRTSLSPIQLPGITGIMGVRCLLLAAIVALSLTGACSLRRSLLVCVGDGLLQS